ncbi:MAG TPA: hypothetical protein VHV79_14080 [Mycobacteriales bacterium]|jgi:hypothetical protein|nr:hypothetical protein [Mycobacteriales bacterium]
MTWLWITVFVLVCTVPMAAYIYLIEVRGHPDDARPAHPANRHDDGRS